MEDGTDTMPYKTEHGTHYHMTEGCCGATIACDAAGLSPCSICCNGGAGASVTGNDRGSGDGIGDESPSSATTKTTGDSSANGRTPKSNQEGDDSRDNSEEGSVIGILGRLRAWSERHSSPTGTRSMPLLSSEKLANLMSRWDEIERACDEAIRASAARKFPQKPKSAEEKSIESCLFLPKVRDVVDMEFAQNLAESSTVIVQWATSSVPVSHRPMGARLDLRDTSDDGRHPTRSATVTSYSLLEPTPEMRRRGILGIGCKSELRCEHGRIGGVQYPGIDGFLWSYGDTSAHVSLVPLSAGEWRHAIGLCDEYESGKGKTTTERIGDGVGTTEERGEIVGRKVSDTAGYDESYESFEKVFESKKNRTVELDSFTIISSEWNRACQRMAGRR